MGTYETREAIREDLADDQVRSATIGPAGENGVLFANVTNDGRARLGRTGHGAMGEQETQGAFGARYPGCPRGEPATLMKISFTAIEAAQGPDTAKYRILGTVTNVLNT